MQSVLPQQFIGIDSIEETGGIAIGGKAGRGQFGFGGTGLQGASDVEFLQLL